MPFPLPVKPLTLPVVAAHCLLLYLVTSLAGNDAWSVQSDSTGPLACPYLLCLSVIGRALWLLPIACSGDRYLRRLPVALLPTVQEDSLCW